MMTNLLLLSLLPLLSAAFAPAARLSITSYSVLTNNVMRPSAVEPLFAKKRRRRKPTTPTPTQSSDELPEFDDDEDDVMEEETAPAVESKPVMKINSQISDAIIGKSTNPTPVKRGTGLNSQLAEEVGGNVDGLDEDTILEAMRGNAGGDKWEPPRSVQDTLSDRRLEKLMDFDKMIEQDRRDGVNEEAQELPDFDDVIARRKQREAMQEGRVEDAAMLIDTTGLGKKAARNAQRKATALQRESEMEEERSNPFEDLKISELLENGAWAGIGSLLLWEVYINSPLFERAAPLIPVVYDNPTLPGI